MTEATTAAPDVLEGAAIDFEVQPSEYRHWSLAVDGDVATLRMAVEPFGGLGSKNYELKLNSYDLQVDIELADAIQRLRFEHPQVRGGGHR